LSVSSFIRLSVSSFIRLSVSSFVRFFFVYPFVRFFVYPFIFLIMYFFLFQHKEVVGEEVTLFFYVATEDKTPGFLDVSSSLDGIEGFTEALRNFSVSVIPFEGTLTHKSYLSTRATGLEKLTETVLRSLKSVSTNYLSIH